jgi:hypothetical protein
MAEQFSNAATATLVAGISPGDTSLTVSDASGFPSSGDFRLRIDNEILLVTAVAGPVFTVSRAVEPYNGVQVASGHGLGANVTAPLTVGSLAEATAPPPLANAHFLVGNGSNVATDVAMSGDVSLANTGATALVALQGNPVSASSPSPGDVLEWNGSAWAPAAGGGGSVAIGSPVGGSSSYFVLAIDGSGDLSQIDPTSNSGWVMTSNGAGAAATFQAPAGGGVSIGSVIGGSPSTGSILFTDSSNQLAQDGSFGLGYDPTGATGPLSSPGYLYFGHSLGGGGQPALCMWNGSLSSWTKMTLLTSNAFQMNSFVTPAAEVSADGGLAFTAQSNGAGGSTGTLNNTPGGGDPTWWLHVVINGSSFHIPCW